MKETNKKSKMQFLKTDNKEVAKQLRQSGFTELTEESSTCYCFLNDGKMTFDADTDKNICYTNILCI